MKKSYFITWLGVLSTLLVTALSVSGKIRKYGQKVYSDKLIKLKPDTSNELFDKGFDLALKKLIK